MSDTYIIMVIAVMASVTILLRFLPFPQPAAEKSTAGDGTEEFGTD